MPSRMPMPALLGPRGVVDHLRPLVPEQATLIHEEERGSREKDTKMEDMTQELYSLYQI